MSIYSQLGPYTRQVALSTWWITWREAQEVVVLGKSTRAAAESASPAEQQTSVRAPDATVVQVLRVK